jgi:hypothetical protein
MKNFNKNGLTHGKNIHISETFDIREELIFLQKNVFGKVIIFGKVNIF